MPEPTVDLKRLCPDPTCRAADNLPHKSGCRWYAAAMRGPAGAARWKWADEHWQEDVQVAPVPPSAVSVLCDPTVPWKETTERLGLNTAKKPTFSCEMEHWSGSVLVWRDGVHFLTINAPILKREQRETLGAIVAQALNEQGGKL